ncbi:unnamed protein product [Rotaria sp. Silwood2]|nr:unnamed protein product [Rotaria sp. Silwood2]CAF3068350.1 unnamed protein product [Rotaria sp. Silwood2]CAF3334737.1 unnamed protein product [Rotaria sp. Silwood2]CAF4383816.1 unnamed protein product [Rotaria sp. Silwood2]CAF4398913.1 unnamed protein product [Rotaria sp. Silwood2]
MSLRHDLTLQQKIELINDNRNGNGLSQRELAGKYNISLGSVLNVLKRKAEYLNDYETNQNQNVKRKLMDVNSQKLNEEVYEWFVQQRSKNIPISEPILQEKAREIAELLEQDNISFRIISGESLSVDITTVNDWIQPIPKITDGYDSKNMFNCDKTGLFFEFMPDKSLTLNREECKGGKKSKERYTILFCVNSTGEEKLKPLVINMYSKSLKPRSFKNLNVNKLPVDWRANKTAWMNVNKSILQPLDPDIIHAFKTHYRKHLVKHIIARCTTAQTSNDIKVTPLDAIYWIDAAWKAGTDTTIRNTFHAAGFKDKQHDDTITSSTDSTKPMYDEPHKDLKILNDLLEHVTIGGQTLNAADFADDYDDDDRIPTESPPKIMEAMEMIRKFHLLTTTQQPQLHQLINQLESKLTDVYINSKTKRQTPLEDFFSTKLNPVLYLKIFQQKTFK